MTTQDILNLTPFISALEQLAAQVDDAGSDPAAISSAATALSSGIAATSLFQSGIDSDPSCPWEGSINGAMLTIYSSTHQFVFSLQLNVLSSAILSGPSGVTWKLNRSEKGLHVAAIDANGSICTDIIIGLDGSTRDSNDLSSELEELKAQWDEIANQPEDSLPPYVPECTLPEIDLPDIDDLPDASASISDGDEDDDGDDGSDDGDDGFNSSMGSFGNMGSNRPFVSDEEFNSTPGVVNLVGAALKGAAAAGVVAGVAVGAGAVAESVGKAFSGSEPVLKLVIENQDGERFEIGKFPFTLGRGKDCSLPIDSKLVSRKHAQFMVKDEIIVLEDLNSSNGSFLNDEPIKDWVAVFKGDKLRFANVSFTVVAGQEREDVPAESMKTVASSSLAEKVQADQRKKEVAVKATQPVAPPANRLSSSDKPVAKSTPPPPPPAPIIEKVAPEPPPKSPGKSPVKCSGCHHKIPADAKFCPSCGAPISQILNCRFCGKKLESDARFCPDCGKPVGASGPDSSPSRVSSPKAPPPPPAPKMNAGRSRPKSEPRPEDDSSQEYARNISGDDDQPAKVLPSVRWVSFLFALVLVADFGTLIEAWGESIFDNVAFHRGLGAAIATVFFAFMAGSSKGFCRIFTLLSAGVFVGNQAFFHHELFLDVFKDPGIIESDPILILPFLSLLFALWIMKRAAKTS